MLNRITNKTFEKYLKNKDKLKKELKDYERELKQTYKRQEQLRDMIRWREDLLGSIEYGGTFIKHHGVIISVRVGRYPNGHKYASVSAPGNDHLNYAEIYTNAHDNTKYGCKIHKSVRNGRSKERLLGTQYSNFNSLLQLCKDWAAGLDIENFFCGDCLVKASCTDTRCNTKIFTGMD